MHTYVVYLCVRRMMVFSQHTRYLYLRRSTPCLSPPPYSSRWSSHRRPNALYIAHTFVRTLGNSKFEVTTNPSIHSPSVGLHWLLPQGLEYLGVCMARSCVVGQTSCCGCRWRLIFDIRHARSRLGGRARRVRGGRLRVAQGRVHADRCDVPGDDRAPRTSRSAWARSSATKPPASRPSRAPRRGRPGAARALPTLSTTACTLRRTAR